MNFLLATYAALNRGTLKSAPAAYLSVQADARRTVAAPDVLDGIIIATQGWFMEDDPRGQFTEESLQSIVSVMRGNDLREGGTKVMLGHDHLEGMLVGRARSPRLSSATRDDCDGPVRAVRADLHFAPAASNSPYGDLQEYVTHVAETDVRGLMMSLVIKPRQIPVRDEPPIWIAQEISGVDLVSSGAATAALLQPEYFPRLDLARRKLAVSKMAMAIAALR